MNAIDYLKTPIGLLEIQASEKDVTHIIFVDEQKQSIVKNERSNQCKLQLNEYFHGERKVFDLPLAAKGTQFQQSVWKQLSDIPFGESASYKEIAVAINNPKSVRAVGAANGRNPISIVVPCHRVIGAKGALTGYSGGLERKQWLLEHEGVLI